METLQLLINDHDSIDLELRSQAIFYENQVRQAVSSLREPDPLGRLLFAKNQDR